jgi:hypothetical protein
MDIKIPGFPALNKKGRIKRPLVLLFGESTWQHSAARSLSRTAQDVILTGHIYPDNLKGPVAEIQTCWPVYFEAADIVMGWCGRYNQYTFRLDHWTFMGWLLGRIPQKVVLGVDREGLHPMIQGLCDLAEMSHVRVAGTLEETLSIAQERCREINRSIDRVRND